MVNILVTDATGFIGKRLVDRLSKTPTNHIIEEGKAATAFSEKSVDYVYHLADSNTGSASDDCRKNILDTVRILDLCKRTGVRKFIYLSSGAVYDPSARRPWIELSLINPLTKVEPNTPYGIGKKCAEEYVRHMFRRHAILRVSNVYGPGQSPADSTIATIADRIRKDQPFHMFGDGAQTRDYVYVDDVVSAAELCMNRISGTFNVSSGTETSLSHLVDMMYRIAKKEKNVIHEPPVQGELLHSCLSNEWLRNAGWQPRWSLKEGLKFSIRD